MKRIKLTLTLALFTLPILNAQDLPSYVPTEGLVAYYPFNGNANDESGNGHHGTVNGATLTTDLNDYSDKAYAFSHDGASFGDNHQSIYIPFHSDFQSETFTIGVWFKADSYGWDGNSKIESTLISKRENSNDINQATYRIQLSSSFTRSEIGSNTGSDEIPCTIDTNPINLDAWYHAASTYDGVTLRQYINGVKTSELVCDLGHNAVSTSGIMLGQTWQYNGYWYHLDGKLDEFMVYNRALSELEMENYYVSATSDILLNGTVSAESNQIKNVADPTDAQDAATKSYVDSNVNAFSGSYSDLTDTPTSSMAFQLPMLTTAQRDEIVASLGMMIYNIDVNEFQGFQNYEKQLPAEIDQQHLTINNGGGENRAQSFTSSATGELTLVKLPLSVMMESISLSFKIIEGEGVNGTVLFETSYYLTNSNQEWIEFGISGVDVISGNLYTIQLIEENSGCGMPPCYNWGMDTSGNNYSGGQFFYNGTPYSNGEYDSAFITYVSSKEFVNEWITLH